MIMSYNNGLRTIVPMRDIMGGNANSEVTTRQMTPEERERLQKLKPPGKKVEFTTAPQKKHSRSGGRGRKHA